MEPPAPNEPAGDFAHINDDLTARLVELGGANGQLRIEGGGDAGQSADWLLLKCLLTAV